jgi:hypothetical protein
MPAVDPAIFERKCTRRPKAVSKEILKLCADISPALVPIPVNVAPEPSAELNNCFHNVASIVAKNGGAILYGWSLWEWPRVFIEAEHHAIWDNNGERAEEVQTPRR